MVPWAKAEALARTAVRTMTMVFMVFMVFDRVFRLPCFSMTTVYKERNRLTGVI